MPRWNDLELFAPAWGEVKSDDNALFAFDDAIAAVKKLRRKYPIYVPDEPVPFG